MKNFSNDKALSTSVAIVVMLFTSLLLSSLLISYFITQMYGENLDTVPIPVDSKSYSSTQNFMSCNTSQTIVKASSGTSWVCQPDVGVMITETSFLSATNGLFIDNIKPDASGWITNKYYINNSVKNLIGMHPDYAIVVKRTGGADDISIQVKGDGFHIPRCQIGQLCIGDLAYIPKSNPNQDISPVIVTHFNDNEHRLDFTFNEERFYVQQDMPIDQNILDIFGRYFGGVMCDQEGFILKYFSTDNDISSQSDAITSMVGLVTTMMKVIGWGIPEKYMPALIHLLLIRSQEGALFIAIIAAFRGV